jgi:inorganic pyrophosphatase
MPEVVDVLVEIPSGSRNKYEYDHERGNIRLDRRLLTATAYPADYGFVPGTLADDGDPLDALVLLEDPTIPGCLVRARVLGVFHMRDEAGRDAKLISVLEHDPMWDDARDVRDLPPHLLAEIEHFFSIYKDLDVDRASTVEGFQGAEAAAEELAACRARYRQEAPAAFPREEIAATVARYHHLRERIDAGEEPDFGVLADFYTDGAVYVDAAWGRIEGKENIARWLVESMVGLDGWKFPIEFTAIEGNDVVVKWTQIIPGRRSDGSRCTQSAYSRLVYAGEGKFSYEEDTYNMAHVLEDLEQSGWRPTEPMNLPPAKPNRDWAPPR